MDDLVKELESWFQSTLREDYDEGAHIRVGTLDNPGWWIDIQVESTVLEGRPFTPIRIDRSDEDWIICRIEDGIFHGSGGVGNLREMLTTFFEWKNNP